MDALHAFRSKLQRYIRQEDEKDSETSESVKQTWSHTRKTLLHLIQDWLDALPPGHGLEEIAQKVDNQLRIEEAELFYMIDDIRVRRSHAFSDGDEMYQCVIRRDLLRYITQWIKDVQHDDDENSRTVKRVGRSRSSAGGGSPEGRS